jgi:Cu(I)/Ag(I) efflux system membrane fusion protein
MKKVLIAILLLAAVGYGGYYFFGGKEEKSNDPDPQPLTIAENSGIFNQSYKQLMAGYYNLKDALVASDTSKANAASKELVVYADSLKINEIMGDSTGMIKETAKTFTGTISGSAQALVKEPTIEAKRKEFEMISDALYTLTQTVRYGGEKIYYQYCPMAFDNKGAYWLSNQPAIRNPYFGDEMLECGEVKDSLDFGKN